MVKRLDCEEGENEGELNNKAYWPSSVVVEHKTSESN